MTADQHPTDAARIAYAWQKTTSLSDEALGELTRRIVDLLGDQPELAAELQPMLKILEQLRSDNTESQLMMQTNRAQWQSSAKRIRAANWVTGREPGTAALPPLHTKPARHLVFRSDESSLFESADGDERPRLQLSIGDYGRIINALDEVKNTEWFSAKELQDATKDESSDRAIPMTQTYLVLRFWRSRNLIEKAGGRRFKTCNWKTFSAFNEAAMMAWTEAMEYPERTDS